VQLVSQIEGQRQIHFGVAPWGIFDKTNVAGCLGISREDETSVAQSYAHASQAIPKKGRSTFRALPGTKIKLRLFAFYFWLKVSFYGSNAFGRVLPSFTFLVSGLSNSFSINQTLRVCRNVSSYARHISRLKTSSSYLGKSFTN